ncbi:MAG: hypothetical protein GY926_17940, partial [bacterium]|nr:hypothetical protein [bacterium]
TMTIDVTAKNDAPTAANNTVATNEDTTYTFTASDFNYSDVDGDTLASVEITTLEAVGALELSAVDVTLNQVISKADIDAGNLKFVPVADANGTGYDSFSFSVNDGTVDSASTYAMTIDVSAQNDAPAFAALDDTPAFTEDGVEVVLDTDVVISDVELDALNTGNGDYNGASVTLNRNGGVSTEDVFSFSDGNGITLETSTSLNKTVLQKSGATIAIFDTTTIPGELRVTFTNANGETPTSADVDNILRQISYANSSDAPPASVQIDWTFDDGNTGGQGTGGALQATGSTTVTTTTVNDAPDFDTAGFSGENVITTAANDAYSVTTADVDGDGDLDVLSASQGDDKIAWYENDGAGNFTAHTITTAANSAFSVSTADVDGDGDMDVLSTSTDKIFWYENDGAENFTAHTITTAVINATSVTTADVDGDGDLDVLSASYVDAKIAWYENDGAGNFTAHTITTAANGAYSVTTADVDGDGDQDVLSASELNNKIAW